MAYGTKSENKAPPFGSPEWSRNVDREPPLNFAFLDEWVAWSAVSARFWAKVDAREQSECWPWMASTNTSGYGRFKMLNGHVTAASRAAYALHWRQDPGDMVVMHTCDNRLCCNPAHLVLGTNRQNNDDKLVKGRGRSGNHKGENNARHILTEKDVTEVRALIAAGWTNIDIGARYGVHHATISAIRVGKTWRAA